MKFQKTILIVGFGSIGKRHTNNILRQTNSNIIILSKRTNIPTQEFYNYNINKSRIKFFSNLNDCLNEIPEVAFITNETSFHVDIAIKLAKQKIHLFIEKPLSNSINNIDKLKKLVKKNNLIVMVACNFRFFPPFKKIKELIDADFLENIISVQSENGTYLPDWHPKENYSNGYAAQNSKGGGVTLTQIHELDYLTWIFGSIKNSYSILGKFSTLKIKADDICISILQLQNNILLELHLDYFSRPYYKRLKIRGTRGILYWNSSKNQLKFFDNLKETWKIISIKNNYSLTGKKVNLMYEDELSYFLTCIISKKQPMNNLSESSKILQCTLDLKS